MAGRLDSATDQLPDFGRIPVPTSLALETRVRIVSLGGELETVPATQRGSVPATAWAPGHLGVNTLSHPRMKEKCKETNDTRPRKVPRNRLQLWGIKSYPKICRADPDFLGETHRMAQSRAQTCSWSQSQKRAHEGGTNGVPPARPCLSEA